MKPKFKVGDVIRFTIDRPQGYLWRLKETVRIEEVTPAHYAVVTLPHLTNHSISCPLMDKHLEFDPLFNSRVMRALRGEN